MESDMDKSDSLADQHIKEVKRTLKEQNKLLVKENRQLKIDCSFYKKAYEDLVREKELANEKTPNKSSTSASAPSVPLTMAKLTTTLMTDGPSERERSKKLLIENKKLKAKVENLNATIKILKSKNQKLKIDIKKLQASQDFDEIACPVKSNKETKKTNATTYTPAVLAWLGQLSRL